jgi:hypothetical protein
MEPHELLQATLSKIAGRNPKVKVNLEEYMLLDSIPDSPARRAFHRNRSTGQRPDSHLSTHSKCRPNLASQSEAVPTHTTQPNRLPAKIFLQVSCLRSPRCSRCATPQPKWFAHAWLRTDRSSEKRLIVAEAPDSCSGSSRPRLADIAGAGSKLSGELNGRPGPRTTFLEAGLRLKLGGVWCPTYGVA